MNRLIIVFCVVIFTGCDLQKEANQKFGDQHFKTAISLIELHNIRTGSYPDALSDIQFRGDWDQIALQSVKYGKVEGGYTLSVTKGWVGKPELQYPPEFWIGLGIKHANNSIHPTAKASAD